MFSSATVVLPLLAAPLALAQTYASTTTFEFAGAALPTGLVASEWPIGEAPYQHEYRRENVVVSDGYLNLIVPGGQQDDEVIWSAEISTDFTVASARVETYAVLTDVPGVCNGEMQQQRPKCDQALTCFQECSCTSPTTRKSTSNGSVIRLLNPTSTPVAVALYSIPTRPSHPAPAPLLRPARSLRMPSLLFTTTASTGTARPALSTWTTSSSTSSRQTCRLRRMVTGCGTTGRKFSCGQELAR